MHKELGFKLIKNLYGKNVIVPKHSFLHSPKSVANYLNSVIKSFRLFSALYNNDFFIIIPIGRRVQGSPGRRKEGRNKVQDHGTVANDHLPLSLSLASLFISHIAFSPFLLRIYSSSLSLFLSISLSASRYLSASPFSRRDDVCGPSWQPPGSTR